MNSQDGKSRDAQRQILLAERVEADAARRLRVNEARDFCRPFMADHLDVAAMSLILLRWEKPKASITRAMVEARVRESYPWIGAA